MARAFVSDGREAVELDPEDVDWAISRCQINEDHVPHVEPAALGQICVATPKKWLRQPRTP